MGRLERLRKKRHKKQRKEAQVRRPKATGSDPEPRGSPSARTEEQYYSSCANNSCDDTLTLCASSSLTSPAKCVADGGHLAPPPPPRRSPADEMEVMRRLSCLNFSVLPCDSMVRLEDHPSSHHHQDGTGPSGAMVGLPSPQLTTRDYDVLSDVDLYSEMTSATHLDLLPMLSDQDGEGAEPYFRHTRKRPSRRKASRRSKKFRCISTRDPPVSKFVRGSAPVGTVTPHQQQPLPPLGLVRTSSKEACASPRGVGPGDATPSSRLTRARSFRRTKRGQQRCHDDDLCCFSDTSVVLDADNSPSFSRDGPQIGRSSCDLPSIGRYEGLDMEEGVVDMFETTPPAVEEEGMCDDALLMESELSESTSDSGCEGDDEESSVEGPPIVMTSAPALSRQPGSLFLRPRPQHPGEAGLPRWWEEEEEGGAGDSPHPGMDKDLQEIMSGSYHLLTAEGRHAMDTVRTSLSSEFKHPGRLGVNRRGSGGGSGGGGGGGGRKKRCKPRELASPLTLRAVNQKMQSFIQDQSGEAGLQLKFNLVSRALCKTIAALADVYMLDCFIEQKRRLPVASPVLRKTSLTRLASREEIEPILRRHGQDGFVTALLVNKDGSNSHSRSSKPHESHTSHSGGGVHHHMVGGGCEALDEGNLGNRMLQGMGWTPGSGLGPESSGITSPIRAYLRTKRAGLGFS